MDFHSVLCYAEQCFTQYFFRRIGSQPSKRRRRFDSINRSMMNDKLKPNDPPKRSLLEEIGNAVTHGVGALFAVAGLVLLLLKAQTPVGVFCAVVYGVCLLMMFLMSCLYHSFRWGTRVKRLWRRFDYISIYLLIGGTFTPMWLLFWQGQAGTVFCAVQWALILLGVIFVAIFGPGRPRVLHPVLFVVLGWVGLVFLPRMVRENMPLFIFILSGGIVYTVGVIPFALKRRGAHFLWHFFVFFGAVIHWFGIYFFLY